MVFFKFVIEMYVEKWRKEINIYNRVGLGRYMNPVKRNTICSERIKGYEMLPADTFNKHLISAHYVSDHEEIGRAHV